jgi:hypothetical protein
VEGMHPHPLSVTTLLKSIASPPGLETWLQKKLIRAALEAYDTSKDQEHAISAGLKSRWQGSEEADFGSSVHMLTEQADMKTLGLIDKIVAVGDMKRAMGFLRQWEKTRDAFNMQILAVETTFVNTELGYAGTADRIVVVPAISPDPIVLDIKSGKNVYPDVAMQCAALANCDKILHDDGKLEAMPWKLNREVGLAAHVRARSCNLIPLDLGKAWPIFKPLPQIALWRAEQIKVLGDPLTPDEVAHLRADLRLRMTQLPPDLRDSVRKIIADNADLAGGNTAIWTEDQLNKVADIFQPFEKESRERFEKVVRNWGDRGDMELKARVLQFSDGRTSSVYELTGSQVDSLIKSF